MIELIMCMSCGEFVTARPEGDAWVPIKNECPQCGGQSFKHTGTDEVVRTSE